jgi:hypothetical protein
MKIFDKIKILLEPSKFAQDYVLTLSEVGTEKKFFGGKVIAIGMNNFNRFHDAVTVADFRNITEEEMKLITSGKEYEFVGHIFG